MARLSAVKNMFTADRLIPGEKRCELTSPSLFFLSLHPLGCKWVRVETRGRGQELYSLSSTDIEENARKVFFPITVFEVDAHTETKQLNNLFVSTWLQNPFYTVIPSALNQVRIIKFIQQKCIKQILRARNSAEYCGNNDEKGHRPHLLGPHGFRADRHINNIAR